VHEFFEGCLPIEILATRGRDALAYGPMRPVGLTDPRTGRRPWACLQLRQDNLAASCYNLVGFQTNLTFPEQRRVFGLIPGLAKAEYLRFGQMHRNTFVNAPALLRPTLQTRTRPDFCSPARSPAWRATPATSPPACLAGINVSRLQRGQTPYILPPTTMLGALCHYVTHCPERDFQPMKANFGILPPLPGATEKTGKRGRAALHAARALEDLARYLLEQGEGPRNPHVPTLS
jgi:methylenetetrahydrofolate--tRNA-(uracil-5-)-methyltransferase